MYLTQDGIIHLKVFTTMTINWFKSIKSLINPTSFISNMLELLILKAEKMNPPFPSLFLQHCLISLMLVVEFPEESQTEGEEISILEDFEYIIDEILLPNVEKTFVVFQEAAKYFVQMFIVLTHIYRENPTEIESKVVEALNLTNEKYVKIEFITAAADGIKHYQEASKITELREVEEKLRKISAEIEKEK